ncbi:MAG TPA: ElyC/SanA/YdcF family protein [Candidatus Binatia bacterium]|nr:ElyC/SanA/YdcF family protein [Candidatus Binatia bacterium]
MPPGEIEVTAQPPAATAGKRPTVRRRLALLVLVVLLGGLALFLLAHAGSFLIIDEPRRSDVIVALEDEGGSVGYDHAVVLQRYGYAARILLDADVAHEFYGRTEAELAEDFLRRTKQSTTEICPTVADSTFAEAADVQRCLQRIGASSAIIVTADFQTRRALSIFRKRLPQYRWSVAASSSPWHYADQYWQHRAWAKTVLQEWEQFLWWELADRWRGDVVLR